MGNAAEWKIPESDSEKWAKIKAEASALPKTLKRGWPRGPRPKAQAAAPTTAAPITTEGSVVLLPAPDTPQRDATEALEASARVPADSDDEPLSHLSSLVLLEGANSGRRG